MNNNLISFNSHQNVFLYFDGPDLKNCVNIDVKDGVDTVVFDGGNSRKGRVGCCRIYPCRGKRQTRPVLRVIKKNKA